MKLAGRLDAWLIGPGRGQGSESYVWLRQLQIRSLGAISWVAFLILFWQGRALWGDRGLLPISRVIDQFHLPSLFVFLEPDAWIRPLAGLGLLFSTFLVLGRANVPLLLGIWAIQLSFVNSGQLFYGYGWETQLLELIFLSLPLVPLWHWKLASSSHPPMRVAIWAQRWMLFRLMLGAGLIKIRGDECWRDLSCLIYHYETQPNPHPLSYFYHQMPALFHQGGVLFNHFVELIVPFGFFGPARIRRWAGIFAIVFQVILISSGNLAWLNWLTLVMSFCCFDDEFLKSISDRLPRHFRWKGPKANQPGLGSKLLVLRRVAMSSFAVIVLFCSWEPALNLVSSRQAMNTSYNAWHLIKSYGAFGSIGRERTAIVIEGTSDPTPTEGSLWKAYELPCATGDPARRPCLVTPYHYHLDWQLWFSAMRPTLQEEWLFRLAIRLLEGDREILALFEKNPFGDAPPKWIRMNLYRYRFGSSTWWERDLIGPYLPPVSLDHPLVSQVK